MYKNYRYDLDLLKGISIIAVVLYHIGIFPFGYLGVDTFLVVNGYFIIPNVLKSISNNSFSFVQWILKRLDRFIPIVLIASLLCLVMGYFTMIPDDYENLSQSVFASNIFANNILAAITTRNYWDTANEFKPLMHFWYLGIVVQFYIVFPLIMQLIGFLLKKIRIKQIEFEKWLLIIVIILGIVSCILYLMPFFKYSDKFYFLPFRIWEFCIGGIIGFIMLKKEIKINNIISVFAWILLVLCFSFAPKNISDLNSITIVGASQSQIDDISKVIILLIVVFLSSIILFNRENEIKKKLYLNIFAIIGKMSLSIFVWHQIILAYARYSFIDNITWKNLIVLILILIVVSYLSYKYIESVKLDFRRRILCYSWLVITLIVSFSIYKNAGVVRNVPELDITLENPFANRNTEYTDKIYKYNKDFCSTDKIKVLVVGNSFARDFACVLLEWDVNHIIELSYLYAPENNNLSRYSECDYLFYFGSKETIPNFVFDNLQKDCKVYGIGTKSYGKSFGRIYAKRFKKDYFESVIPENPVCAQINEEWKKSWGENFIDFMDASKTPDGYIRLFTDDHKVISFDCRHLTKNGAIFYAKRLNLEKIFNK